MFATDDARRLLRRRKTPQLVLGCLGLAKNPRAIADLFDVLHALEVRGRVENRLAILFGKLAQPLGIAIERSQQARAGRRILILQGAVELPHRFLTIGRQMQKLAQIAAQARVMGCVFFPLLERRRLSSVSSSAADRRRSNTMPEQQHQDAKNAAAA